MPETIDQRKAQWLEVLDAHGGYHDVTHCPTHGERRCADWTEAWAEYERALDDERAAAGHQRHYVYRPTGRATW